MWVMILGLAVDHGKVKAGVAFFDVERRVVIYAGLVVLPEKVEGPLAAREMAQAILRAVQDGPIAYLVLETPQTYGGRAGAGDANDLFPLAALNGALVVAFPHAQVTSYTPREWKGSVEKPKKVADAYSIEEKVRARLSPAELKNITWPKNVAHGYDVTDAVGLALKFMGRFEKVRAFARD